MSTETNRGPSLTRLERWWLAGIGLPLLALFWSALCTAPGIPWNAGRLATSFALARGLPIYALRSSGAQLGWAYGPVYPLWFLPAGLTDNPTMGLMIAGVLNAVAMVAPLWIALRGVLGRDTGLVFPLTLLGTVLLWANPLSNHAFSMIHVDALCIGWSVVSCVALHARVMREWKPGLPLAAVALALAVATKQVAITLVPATILWLWRERQTRLLGNWIISLGIICGGLAVVTLRAFGPEELLFNTWLFFTRMPWRGGWGQLGVNIVDITASSSFWILAAIVGAWLMRGWRLQPSPAASSFARLMLWVTVIGLPMGLAASMVLGAELNSVHFPRFLLVAGLVTWGSGLAVAQRTTATPPAGLRPAFAAVTLLGVALGFVFVLRRDTVWTPYRGQEVALAAVRESHGKLYLPWNPIPTIIAERKIYPFDGALKYMWHAGVEPPRAAIKAAVPEGAALLYNEPSQSHFALNYFGRDQRDPPIDR
ncbi:MAG TPA: hypothetical protein VFJ90_16870 [Candidatus Didemnitutus sp.]|nr:hypothetical protein [Candidatus Didemnitutus sp.]